jgi:hypothetical protein
MPVARDRNAARLAFQRVSVLIADSARLVGVSTAAVAVRILSGSACPALSRTTGEISQLSPVRADSCRKDWRAVSGRELVSRARSLFPSDFGEQFVGGVGPGEVLAALVPPVNEFADLGRGRPDRFRLDQRYWPVLPGRHCTVVNCNPPCRALVPEGDTCRMSHAARCREQLGRLQRNLPPECAGAVTAGEVAFG